MVSRVRHRIHIGSFAVNYPSFVFRIEIDISFCTVSLLILISESEWSCEFYDCLDSMEFDDQVKLKYVGMQFLNN